MEQAIGAFEANRYQEALRAAKSLLDDVPQVPAVRELAGLAAYRLGRWREAVRNLESYRTISGQADCVPPLMDAYRALGRRGKVAELWSDLRHDAPDADIVAEARIVAAGALADAGDLSAAISLLETAAAKSLRNPADRHLRQWYALGDLYERAGDLPKARQFFGRVLRKDPEAYDIADRMAALGPERRKRRPKRITAQAESA